jgi:hypothetical protein
MQIRSKFTSNVAPVAVMLCHLVGCGEDEVASASITETTTEGPSTATGDPTEELPTGGEPENDLNCYEGTYPISGAPFTVAGPKFFDLRISEQCNSLNFDMDLRDTFIAVYHPDPLPDTPLPVVVMTNGAGGQAARYYEHILQPLARMGFIVFSVQSEGKVSTRLLEMACTLRYLRKFWNIENQQMFPGENPAKFSCDLVLMGHSRGGGAAYGLGSNLELLKKAHWWDINPSGFDMNLRALVAIAPKFSLDEVTGYIPKKSIPYLVMMGATDEDIAHEAIPSYDHMVRELEQSESDPGKLLLWPYNVTHSAFGGYDVNQMSSPTTARGQAIAAGFIPPFIELFVMGNEARYDIFTGAELPDELSSNVESWWGSLEPQFTELGGPVIPRDFVVDQRVTPGVRQTLDNFEDGGAFISSLDAGQTVVGSHSELAISSPAVGHFGNVLKVSWGDPQLGGDVTWELNDGMGKDLSDVSFFSLRIGQELPPIGSEMCMLLMADPHRDALTLNVRLEDLMSNTSEVSLGPIIQQDFRMVSSPVKPPYCAWSQFMQTLRIPMDNFCDPGFDIESVVSLTIEFPDLEFETAIFMDTLEFTSHPLDAAHLCM